MEECIVEKPKFKKITEDEIKKAYNYQKDIGWTFNNERELTETTFHNRFNFLLLAYSLFINAYFMVNDINDKLTILIIGLIIIFLLSIGILRAYTRFIILLNVLHSLDDRDVVPIISKEYKTKRIYGFFTNSNTIGFIVPIVMLLSLIIGIIFNVLLRR